MNNTIQVALEALKDTYVPYSHFSVGAGLKLKNGQIIKGVNIENVSYGLTNCAERTAIFTAVANGARKGDFVELVVSGETEQPIAPCGACRQVMVEFFEPQMPIILINNKGQKITTNIAELMPGAFSDLK